MRPRRPKSAQGRWKINQPEVKSIHEIPSGQTRASSHINQARFNQSHQGNYRIKTDELSIRDSGRYNQVKGQSQDFSGNYRIENFRSKANTNSTRSDQLMPPRQGMRARDYQSNQRIYQSRLRQPDLQADYRGANSRVAGYTGQNSNRQRPRSSHSQSQVRYLGNDYLNHSHPKRPRQARHKGTGIDLGLERLPGGRPKLFAVYSLLYILMFLACLQFLPFNRVNQVKVTGIESPLADSVAKSSRILPFDSKKEVLRQRHAIIKKIKEENPQVDQVEIKADQWPYLELAVTANDFLAILPSDSSDTIYYLLSSGDSFEMDQDQRNQVTSLPKLYDFKDQDKLNLLASSLSHLDKNLLKDIDSIYLSQNTNKPNTIEVKMKDGNVVKALMYTFAQKMQYYPQMVQELGGRQGIINLEVGAYFTPMDNSDNSVKLDTNIDNY